MSDIFSSTQSVAGANMLVYRRADGGQASEIHTFCPTDNWYHYHERTTMLFLDQSTFKC